MEGASGPSESSMTIYPAHQHTGAFHEWAEDLLSGLGATGQVGEFILHALSDGVRLFALLVGIMLVISFLQTFLNFQRIQQKLAGLNGFCGILLAVGLGMLSPFCSCTVIPVVIGMLGLGIPVTVVICFLTCSSMLNLTTIVALLSASQWEFSLLYFCASLAVILLSTLLCRFLAPEQYVRTLFGEEDSCECDECCSAREGVQLTVGLRIREALHATGHLLERVWIFLLVGVLISSAVQSFVPAETLTGMIQGNGVLAVILACLAGAPLHSDVFTVLPLIELSESASISVALALSLGTMCISVSEIVLLIRVFRTKFIAIYSAVLVGLSLLVSLLSLMIFG